MTKHLVCRQSGMALFQVLLMVAIFSILLLIMVGYSQQSIRQTQAAQDAIETKLAMYSASNLLQYQLLTTQWLGEKADDSQPGWNFYGLPFSLLLPPQPVYAALNSEIQVKIQDERGLLDLRYPTDKLETLLVYLGIPALEAASMRQVLTDAQQPKMAGAGLQLNAGYPYLQIQSFSELTQLPEWNPAIVDSVKPYVSLSGGIFNPAMAPDSLLTALLPAAQVDIIRQWRLDGNFDFSRFSALTGIEQDEILSFYPGNLVSIALTDPESQTRLSVLIKIEPYSHSPLILFGQQYGN